MFDRLQPAEKYIKGAVLFKKFSRISGERNLPPLFFPSGAATGLHPFSMTRCFLLKNYVGEIGGEKLKDKGWLAFFGFQGRGEGIPPPLSSSGAATVYAYL